MNLSDFPSKTDLAYQLPSESWGMPSESLLRAPGELPESLLECLGGHSDQISAKCNFFKMGMSQNFRNVSFSEIKAPAGAT